MNNKGKEMNFEKALAELEQIVNKLEKGGLALNESLALFEKGIKLTRFLRSELDKAEKKIEILLRDEKGELKAQNFDPETFNAITEEEGPGKNDEEV
ncbi:MAG: exodeoxyribonuclease VII small subunit [Acidobacteriota bacterium]|nr:exodeoxyribonuclease VII small subunit [Acidobacteriota bacterium]MDW3228331.1 exodeoxyribonuclease VII small subunit [Acidobacteriota bacterium]